MAAIAMMAFAGIAFGGVRMKEVCQMPQRSQCDQSSRIDDGCHAGRKGIGKSEILKTNESAIQVRNQKFKSDVQLEEVSI